MLPRRSPEIQLWDHGEPMGGAREAGLERPVALLVVDDDPSVQELLLEVLSGAGYRVDAVYDADQAAERIAKDAYDGLVLDLVLPEEDGFTFYDRILRSHPHLRNRVVFISGLAREHTVRRITRAAGDSLLLKPFSILDLLSMLNRKGL